MRVWVGGLFSFVLCRATCLVLKYFREQDKFCTLLNSELHCACASWFIGRAVLKPHQTLRKAMSCKSGICARRSEISRTCRSGSCSGQLSLLKIMRTVCASLLLTQHKPGLWQTYPISLRVSLNSARRYVWLRGYTAPCRCVLSRNWLDGSLWISSSGGVRMSLIVASATILTYCTSPGW
jgi:hypothetical protein